MKRLQDKIAIVTGGNSGIGKATASLFAKEGAKVLITGRRHEENIAVCREISDQGGIICSVDADVSTPEGSHAVVDGCMANFGRIDILVNSAGIADKHYPIDRCTEEWYDHVVKIDQYATFYMCKYVLEAMEPQKSGSIINVSSIGSQGISGIAYSAAKAAVNSMTKNIAIRYAATGIRCNAVAPGATPTPLNAPDKIKTFDEVFAAACGRHFDGTLPEPQAEDQAAAILFFASDDSKAITGQILYVDHGATLF